MAITQKALIDYLTELGAKGATSKDLAKKFGTTSKLINNKFSAEHTNYESTWRGVYSITNIEHRYFRHYAVPNVFEEPKAGADPKPTRITVRVKIPVRDPMDVDD